MQMTFKVVTAAGTNPTWLGAHVIADGGSWHMHTPVTHNKRHTIFITCNNLEQASVLQAMQAQTGIESVEKIIEIGRVTDDESFHCI